MGLDTKPEETVINDSVYLEYSQFLAELKDIDDNDSEDQDDFDSEEEFTNSIESDGMP
jgi:hypothetical protein